MDLGESHFRRTVISRPSLNVLGPTRARRTRLCVISVFRNLEREYCDRVGDISAATERCAKKPILRIKIVAVSWSVPMNRHQAARTKGRTNRRCSPGNDAPLPNTTQRSFQSYIVAFTRMFHYHKIDSTTLMSFDAC